jgi:DNA-binding response OmpR family regulator
MADARKRILCIEDDRETAALIVEELADRGFDPSAAYDGHEGLVAILKTSPDSVLCDLNMPIMSMTDRENELRARRLGADDYVTKPFDFDMLYTIINGRLAGVARNEPKLTTLNEREIEMLTLVARGNTSAQIAEIVALAKRTVDFHLDSARQKLGAATRTEAAFKAAVGKLIEL